MIALESRKPKKKYAVGAECPQCGYDDMSFLDPKKWGEKFIGDKEEIHILCPLCGTRFTGQLHEEAKTG
jgi:predicted RNA-binding Zn-ribbon protein involved in translation (DUF1610 family)